MMFFAIFTSLYILWCRHEIYQYVNAIGACQHCDTIMNFFDKQLKTLDSEVKKSFPNEVPMIHPSHG